MKESSGPEKGNSTTKVTNSRQGNEMCPGFDAIDSAAVWRHLDALYFEEGGDLMDAAVALLDAIRIELESGDPLDISGLTLLLDAAKREIGRTELHISGIVEAMAGMEVVS